MLKGSIRRGITGKIAETQPALRVPTLQLDDGSIMTESAAIALMILDEHPHLAPPTGTPERNQFWRLLVWLVANVYPTFTYADYPERFVPGAAQELRDHCIAYRKSLYIWLEQQLHATPYAFGEQLTLLDIYICVIRTRGHGMTGLRKTRRKSARLPMRFARNPGCSPFCAVTTLFDN